MLKCFAPTSESITGKLHAKVIKAKMTTSRAIVLFFFIVFILSR